MSPTTTTVPGPHPATLTGPHLRKQCQVTFGRTSGPGGQHRNKVETAVRIIHVPTGIRAAAGERHQESGTGRKSSQREPTASRISSFSSTTSMDSQKPVSLMP